MTIEWLDGEGVEDEAPAVTKAGSLSGGLSSWLVLAAEEQTADGAIEFVASSAAVDRMDDSIDQQTWKLKNFRRNPVFLADHRGTDVVGRCPKVGRTVAEDGSQQLRIRVQFDESELNPRGMLLAHQHRNGFRNAVSVGFIPGESTNRTKLPSDHPLHVDPASKSSWMAGSVYRHCELLEVSSVGIPANPDALQLSAGVSDEAISKALDQHLPKRLREIVLDILRRDAEIKRAIVGLLMAQPTNTPARGGLDHLWSK